MKKILFTIHHPRHIEICDDVQWAGKKITTLSKQHIQNAIDFCNKMILRSGTDHQTRYNEFVANEWLFIMKKLLTLNTNRK